jgi:hypothetical protein
MLYRMKEHVMGTTNISFKANSKRRCAPLAASALIAALAGYGAQPSFAQESGQKTFSSPTEASHALFNAVQKEDEAGLEAILGKEVLSPEKEAARLEHHHFTDKYQEMHRLVQEPEGITVLYVGAENWPFPIPLVSKNGKWYFDSQEGKQEILFRRIGENEITALEVCDRFVAAKKQPGAKAASDDPLSQYAGNLAGTGASNAGKESFHGYYFQIATSDSGGKKTGGLTLVAYPAEYRASGVMTFVVAVDGTVYEKDLGANTPQLARQLNQRPAGWHTVQ